MKLQFGEIIEGYTIPVINERVARAGAGILFLFGMVSFFFRSCIWDLPWV